MILAALQNTALGQFAAGCQESTFFTIRSWAQYVPKATAPGGIGCQLKFEQYGIGTFWLILAGIIDILLRIGTFVAIGYFIYGAIRMVTSQGSPEGVKGARDTMVNSMIGLLITIMASWFLGYFVKVVFNIT